MTVQERMRPELLAGGFTRFDATTQFYLRVNSLLSPEMTVLDVGAGRGSFLEHPSRVQRDLQLLRGKVREVIGLDIDDVVKHNPALDRGIKVDIGDPFPLADHSIDIIVSDWTLEHIDSPKQFAEEVERVLKPGGWFCARTPSKWSLTAFGARLIPNKFHAQALRRIQPFRKEIDIFPTRYKLNTFAALRNYFPPSRWYHASYGWHGEPAYHFEILAVWRIMSALFSILPTGMASNMLIFLKKR